MDLAQLTRDLDALSTSTRAAVEAAPDVAALAALELEILGKKGRLTEILRGIGSLPVEERPQVGAVANVVRRSIEQVLAERHAALSGSELEARLLAERVDVTTPGRPVRRGALHPSIEAMGEIAEIFGRFGFVVH
ncbi:MAG TPA: phenylalanine--tRNA ligase subunit alpha, partial [Candidatus Limnocylindrales bacterium]|nr:phenylalanine--tRNA ligase subunit alpha [Candidatus Limnocylindrales bacterium]